LDRTRTICGRNGRNSDSVRNESFINPLKKTVCGQWISSTNSMGRHSARKNDGVSFGKLSADKIILFGFYQVLQIFCGLQKLILEFFAGTMAMIKNSGESIC